jgi:5-deoxy-glucuronate isomerase
MHLHHPVNLHHHYEPGDGYEAIIHRDEGPMRFLNFGVLRLRVGDTYDGDSIHTEIALVVLSGRCRLQIGENLTAELGEREHVFAGCASAAYVPRNTDFGIAALTDVEVAFCEALCNEDHPAAVVRPEGVRVRQVGKDNWARTVTDIIGENVPAQRLIVGETFNPPGNWSSAPPHRHDNDNPPIESDMEEVYFYRLRPEQGFGLQRVYEPHRHLDEVYTVRQNDVVCIPYGYHPVVAAPGYQLYYLWMLAGERRLLIPYDDPEHAWVKRSCMRCVDAEPRLRADRPQPSRRSVRGPGRGERLARGTRAGATRPRPRDDGMGRKRLRPRRRLCRPPQRDPSELARDRTRV